MEQSEPNRRDPQRVTALVRAAQAGDKMAVGDLLDLLTPYVRRLCGPIALDEGADATQEALIAIFRNLGQLRAAEALFGWVRTVAVREAVRIAQRRSAHAELTDLPAAGDPQLAVDVADVLRRLSPEHRATLLLREVEGIDEQHAAQLLTVPVGTAKSRLSRARTVSGRSGSHDRSRLASRRIRPRPSAPGRRRNHPRHVNPRDRPGRTVGIGLGCSRRPRRRIAPLAVPRHPLPESHPHRGQ